MSIDDPGEDVGEVSYLTCSTSVAAELERCEGQIHNPHNMGVENFSTTSTNAPNRSTPSLRLLRHKPHRIPFVPSGGHLSIYPN